MILRSHGQCVEPPARALRQLHFEKSPFVFFVVGMLLRKAGEALARATGMELVIGRERERTGEKEKERIREGKAFPQTSVGGKGCTILDGFGF